MLGWGRALEEDKRAGAGETRSATRPGALQRQTSWAPSAARSRQEPRAFTPEAGSPDTLRDGNWGSELPDKPHQLPQAQGQSSTIQDMPEA